MCIVSSVVMVCVTVGRTMTLGRNRLAGIQNAITSNSKRDRTLLTRCVVLCCYNLFFVVLISNQGIFTFLYSYASLDLFRIG